MNKAPKASIARQSVGEALRSWEASPEDGFPVAGNWRWSPP
ncbi:MAG: hypothetical protein QNJ34_15695 [Xenococcaceae cyanobacterium MO_188.B29]|nr:hypothetical protein [Xenococcaceae cyanobacterium MO_188.B29]